MSAVDVLAIGETMAMVTPLKGGRLTGQAQLGLRPGGAESNVAAMMSRLGYRTAWASAVGSDPLGDVVVDALSDDGVDVRWVRRDPTRPTGVYFKDPTPLGTTVHYYRTGSAASAMSSRDLDAWLRMTPRIVHLSGITAGLSPECSALLDAILVDRAFGDAIVSFDVNYRPRLWESSAGSSLRRLAQHADIVFVGRDEAESLWNTTDSASVRKLIDRPQDVVVKDGAVEATSYTGNCQCAVPALRSEVIDVVGAGDAFASGWLSGHLAQHDALTKLAMGHWVARQVLRSPSDLAQVPLADDVAVLAREAALGSEPDGARGVTAERAPAIEG